MQELIRHLPAPLVLGTLVGIFLGIYRHNRASRVRFWIVAWSLIFLHFLLPIVELHPTRLNALLDAIDPATLQLAGIVFVFSLAPTRLTEGVRWIACLVIGIPLALYSALWALNSPHHAMEAACLVIITVAGFGTYQYYLIERDFWDSFAQLVIAAVGVISVVQLLHGNVEGPYYGIMMATYAVAGFFVVRNYWRLSPGVIVTCGGMTAWAGVWLLAAYAPFTIASIGDAGAELWNVPKFIVAFGMILILLEDEALGAQSARDREHALNRQLERFAEITSQLLGAVDVPPFCEKIARVITEEGNFHRVVVLLADDNHTLRVAGHSGLTPDVLAHVQSVALRMNLEEITRLCQTTSRLGKNSYRIHAENIAEGRFMPTGRSYANHARWKQGDELLVPLQSHRGHSVGCFFLDEPRDVERITPEELIKIELLAADLAVAIDRSTMQRQLVLREKLVGVGQLVSGVAHELNNPLTAVLGYTELMGDYKLQPEVARDLGIVRREANRMKRIIENLLRFSRQSRTETTSTDFNAVLQDVLTLREYDLNGRGIIFTAAVPQPLPVLAIDQSQLKIVLSNLLANAIDAVQESGTKQISIAARVVGEKVRINIHDSGPGFPDLDRIFDPFFTTKSPGRGMGLGLSICYGIMRQHGGDIYATNMSPHGACVSLELPAASNVQRTHAEVVG